MRPMEITTGINIYAEGSALIKVGHTHVICTASVEDKVPPFLRDTNQGWVTSEYGMIPRATDQRTQREATRGKASGRTQAIQRLIGRPLRRGPGHRREAALLPRRDEGDARAGGPRDQPPVRAAEEDAARRPAGAPSAPVTPVPPRVLVATFNPGKARELARLLAPAGVAGVPPGDLGVRRPYEETGPTYRENPPGKAAPQAAPAPDAGPA